MLDQVRSFIVKGADSATAAFLTLPVRHQRSVRPKLPWHSEKWRGSANFVYQGFGCDKDYRI